MKKQTYILTLVFLIGSLNIFACDCGYLGGFVYSNQVTDIVVYGTVIEYDSIGTYDAPDNPYSMKFLIKEKLRGIEQRDTIIVWGDFGADCRPYIDHFKPNTEWILALNKLDTTKTTDYEISICGEFYVPVNKGKVTGKIFGWKFQQKEETYDYNYIKKLVLNPWEYPAQRPEKKLKKTGEGLVYLSNCDILPQNSLDYKALNRIVNENIDASLNFMNSGDSYLIHIRAIIDENGEYHSNGFYDMNKPEELVPIVNHISEILRNTGVWSVGYEENKAVSSEVIIPIILKK